MAGNSSAYFRNTGAILLARLPSVALAVVLARTFGVSDETDRFFFALGLVTFALNIAVSVAEVTVVPHLIGLRMSGVPEGRFIARFAVSMIAVSAAVLAAACAAVAAVSAPAASWSSGGVLPRVIQLVPYLVGGVGSSVLAGWLTSRGAFASSALVAGVTPLSVLTAVLFGAEGGVAVLAVGYLLGEVARLAILVAILARGKTRQVPPALPVREPPPGFTRPALYQILGSAVLALYPLVDRTMIASYGSGSLTVLAYAERLWQIPVGFATSGLLAILLVSWSERYNKESRLDGVAADARTQAARAFLAASAVVVPLIALRAVVARITIGPDDALQVEALSSTFGYMLGGIPLYCAGLVYTRAFLVIQGTGWLLLGACISLGLKASFNSILAPRLGIGGFGLSTSLMYSASTLYLITVFETIRRRRRA